MVSGSWVLKDERETLHVADDARRVCIVETLTVTGGSPPQTITPRFRYQLDNHLGTCCVEVDQVGAVISYEEYHPYGTSAYRAFAGEVSAKRYRYTGKERDEETSLYYHGARYYAPWLGRWTQADPAGTVDGTNLYAYVRGSPVGLVDPNGMESGPGITIDQRVLDLAVTPSAPDAPQEQELKVSGPIRSGPTPGRATGQEPVSAGQGPVLVPEEPDQGLTIDPEGVKGAIRANEASKGEAIFERDKALADERARNISKQMGGGGEYLSKGAIKLTVGAALLAYDAPAILAGGYRLLAGGGRLIAAGGRAVAQGARGLARAGEFEFEGSLGLEGLGQGAGGFVQTTSTGSSRWATLGSTGGALGKTSWTGEVTIGRGLSQQVRHETLRHEYVHRVLSPTGPGRFQQARAALKARAYWGSHLLRYTEEALAEGFATGSVVRGLQFPLNPAYGISGARVAGEAALYFGGVGGAIYMGATY